MAHLVDCNDDGAGESDAVQNRRRVRSTCYEESARRSAVAGRTGRTMVAMRSGIEAISSSWDWA
jgi:hypothetical protein